MKRINKFWNVLLSVLLFGFILTGSVFAESPALMANPQMGDNSDKMMGLMFLLLGISLVLIILFIVLSITRKKK